MTKVHREKKRQSKRVNEEDAAIRVGWNGYDYKAFWCAEECRSPSDGVEDEE